MWAHCDMKIQIPHFLRLTQKKAASFQKVEHDMKMGWYTVVKWQVGTPSRHACHL